ncbi:MAG: hypothetical protein ABI615_04305 [Chthoniobacterales bacterium]
MKPFLPMLAILMAVMSSPIRAEDKPMTLPAGMKGSYESIEGTIEKVYSAERDGFSYRAYVVKWHDQEVVVPNMLSLGEEKKVGDKITFMAQQMEMPVMGKTIKIIQFMAMDGGAMQKMLTDKKSAPSPSPTPTSMPNSNK